MLQDLNETILKDFLQNSWKCIEIIVKELAKFKSAEKMKPRLFRFRNERGEEVALDNKHFFLRASVEYSNPQVTLEEVQGIIAARLLEVCGNYFFDYSLRAIDKKDVEIILEMLRKPPESTIIPFLLNTDDVEPDRYSANPFRQSIVDSGQSAFPSAYVKTDGLKIDTEFVSKYNEVLISKADVELITRHLETSNNCYVDMVDSVKYEQLESLSKSFGIDLCIISSRMPLAILEKEEKGGLLHHIISEVHTDFNSIERAYKCMRRSIYGGTTLLTVPHSEKGYGSKRAAGGKMEFEGNRLKQVHVNYKTTPLYANDADLEDVSVARADDNFVVEGQRFANYNFRDLPSSPQFSLYALGSPENAAIWHGIGMYGARQLLKSITNVRLACAGDLLVKNLKEIYSVSTGATLNFNLAPRKMWMHPVHQNIDASMGCIKNLNDLVNSGMWLEYLSDSSKG